MEKEGGLEVDRAWKDEIACFLVSQFFRFSVDIGKTF